MFRVRNLIGVGVAMILMLALTTAGVLAQPVQQGTATPEATATLEATATVEATQVVTPTETSVPTVEPTATSVAPAVSPLATPTAVSTPGTLPTTGGSDDGTAALSLLVVAVGAVLILGAFTLALSRRTH